MIRKAEHLSALWLAVLQQLTDHIAHDVRNALNGVAVNLEVVRSRAARGAEGAAIAPFVIAAAAQLDVLTGQADALVGLLRSPAGSTDVAGLLGRLVNLAHGAGKGTIELDVPMNSGGAMTRADPMAVRLALAAALLAALKREGHVACRLGTEDAATVYIECDAGGPLTLAGEIKAAVTEAGISLAPAAHGITISFPPNPPD
jgi:hypothetical protein